MRNVVVRFLGGNNEDGCLIGSSLFDTLDLESLGVDFWLCYHYSSRGSLNNLIAFSLAINSFSVLAKSMFLHHSWPSSIFS